MRTGMGRGRWGEREMGREGDGGRERGRIKKDICNLRAFRSSSSSESNMFFEGAERGGFSITDVSPSSNGGEEEKGGEEEVKAGEDGVGGRMGGIGGSSSSSKMLFLSFSFSLAFVFAFSFGFVGSVGFLGSKPLNMMPYIEEKKRIKRVKKETISINLASSSCSSFLHSHPSLHNLSLSIFTFFFVVAGEVVVGVALATKGEGCGGEGRE